MIIAYLVRKIKYFRMVYGIVSVSRQTHKKNSTAMPWSSD